MDELVSDFICEAADTLGGLQAGLARLAVARNDPTAALQMLRRLHGLKGICSVMGFPRAETLCHAGETLLAGMVGAAAPPAALAPLSDMIQQLGRLLSAAVDRDSEPEGEDDALIARLEACAARLQAHEIRPLAQRLEAAPSRAPEPVGPGRRTRDPWVGLDTLARALGDRLGKRIELVVGGDDLKIAAAAAAPLRTALIALVRNACDHGVEPPAERRAAGKPGLSILKLSVARLGDGALLELCDDGRGIDPADLRARWPGAAEGLDDGAVYDLLFAAGVTTAPAITNISGRGVGLDLVRRELARLGGTAAIDSAPGKGARVTLALPATALAAISAGQAAA